MSESEIKVGDVVRLKSGGPAMTVTSCDSIDADCEWFRDGQLERWKYPIIVLEVAQVAVPPSPAP